jgi:hypothetical protein
MKVPNLSTISTIIDRLCIENVKRAHFEFIVETEGVTPTLNEKISHQDTVIETIKAELESSLNEVFLKGEYQYLDEKRTFGNVK